MHRANIYLAIVLLTAEAAIAQSLRVLNVDPAGFPTITAEFYAFDAAGKPVSPDPASITVTEDSVPRTVTNVSCPPPAQSPGVSIALSIDISGSMEFGNGAGIPVELGKRTALDVIALTGLGVNLLNGQPTNEFALQTCDDRGILIQDFTSDTATLDSEIRAINSSGGNNDFAEQLLNPQTGLLAIAKMGHNNRAAILYTDAYWYALSDLELQHCIDLCTKNGIRFFAVIYSKPEAGPDGIKRSLQAIATASGGAMLDGVTSLQAAQSVAAQLRQQVLALRPCTLSWESVPDCSGKRKRNVSVMWSGDTSSAAYFLPPNAVPSLDIQPSPMLFRGYALGVSHDTTIRVTAVNAAQTVTNIVSSNPAFTISPTSFTLQAGASKILTLTFTPRDSGYTWGKMDFVTPLCSFPFYASGGFRGHKPKASTLKLTFPNGGEQIVAGSDTSVRWIGVPPAEALLVDVSLDDGNTWNAIDSSAPGLQLGWHVPRTPSTNCLMRVRQIALDDSGWATGSMNAIGSASANAVATDALGNCYVAGSFHGTITIGSVILRSSNGTDAAGGFINDVFLAKFNAAGQIVWVRSGGGEGNDVASGIAVDAKLNVYFTGYYNDSPYGLSLYKDTAQFAGHVLPTSTDPLNDNRVRGQYFLVKCDADGNILWTKGLAVTQHYSNLGFPTTPSISADTSGNLYIVNDTLDVAKYSSAGALLWAVGGTNVIPDRGHSFSSVAVDAGGSIFAGGSLSGSVNFGGLLLKHDLPDTQYHFHDALVVRYDENGNAHWATCSSSWGDAQGVRVLPDGQGGFYLAGYSGGGDVHFGNNVMTKGDNFEDGFIVRYGSSGTPLWARSFGGGHFNNDLEPYIRNGPSEFDMVSDNGGAVYVAGGFSDSVHAGTTLFANNGTGDFFVACYDTAGHFLFSEKAGPNLGATLNQIASDPLGNVFLTGDFLQSAFFSGHNLRDTGTSQDMFLWRLASEYLQMDLSDSDWSIVTPTPTSENVDMGIALVGTKKDSLVMQFIRNKGSYEFTVDSILIRGLNASEFSLVSHNPPFIVAPGDSHAVEFQFAPVATGQRIATLAAFTQSDTLSLSIKGNGVAPQLALANGLVDFGRVNVGKYKDSIQVLAICNVGGSAVNLSSVVSTPNDTDFTILGGGGNFTLLPGDTAHMDLRFRPSRPGRTSGRVLFQFGDVGSPAALQLFGEGVMNGPRILATSGTLAPQACGSEMLDTFTISNLGADSLVVRRAIITGLDSANFTLHSSFVEMRIAPDSSQLLVVRFTSQFAGDRSAFLTLISNSVNDSILTLQLSGRKDSIGFATVATIDLGFICPNQSVDTTISIVNTGSVSNTARVVSTLGVTQSSIAVASGLSSIDSIHFAGSATEGPFDIPLTITDSICGTSQTVHIIGTIASPQLAANNLSLTGGVGVPTQATLMLYNTGSRDATILQAPAIALFVIVSPAFPFVVKAKDSVALTVQYTAVDTSSHQVSATFGGSPCFDSATAVITGRGASSSATIQAQSAYGYPGDAVDIPIMLMDSINLVQSNATSLSTTLQFNASLLFPIGSTPSGTLSNNNMTRSIPLTFPLPPASSTLGVLHFRAMLGNDTSTALTLQNAAADVPTVAVSAQPGTFTLLGTCRQGGPQLFYSNGVAQIASVRPNPAQDALTIDITTIESGTTTLRLMNALGAPMATIINGELTSGAHTFLIATSDLPTGTYYLELRTPTIREARRVAVVR